MTYFKNNHNFLFLKVGKSIGKFEEIIHTYVKYILIALVVVISFCFFEMSHFSLMFDMKTAYH